MTVSCCAPLLVLQTKRGFSFIISSICMSVLCALLFALFYYLLFFSTLFSLLRCSSSKQKIHTKKKNNWTMNALRLGASRLAPSVFKTANGSLRRQVLGKCVIFKINVKSIWNQLLSLFGRTVVIVVISSPIVCSSTSCT